MTHTPDYKPQTWATEPRARVEAVVRLLAAVRRRRRVLVAVRRLGAWLAVALGLLVPVVLVMRLDAADVPVTAMAAVLVVAALGHAMAQRHRWRDLAREIDARTGAQDRLATALWLAETGRADGWALVQADAAQAWARGQSAQVLEPWHWPAGLTWSGVTGVLVALAVFLPLDLPLRWTGLRSSAPVAGLVLELPGGPQPFTSAAALLGEDATKLLNADAKLLDGITEQVTDEPTKAWLGEVRKVIDGVAEGRLDKRQALEQLAQLEAQKPAAPEHPMDALDPAAQPATPGAEPQTPEQKAEAQEQKDQALKNAVAEAAKEAAKAAPKGEEKKLLEEAAEKKDLGLLAKLAEKIAQKDMSDKELEQWIKAAEKFAGALKDQKVPDKFKDLADRVNRLQKKRAEEGGLGASDQERLKSARRELEQLKRENGDALAAQHQVQRLERGAQQAADMLRRAQEQDRLGKKDKQSDAERKQAQEELKRQMRAAANELRRENERQQDRQAQRIGQNRMRELRESLERTGKQQDSARREFDRKATQNGENPERQEGPQRLGQKQDKESAEARDAKRMQEGRQKGDKPGEGEGEGQGQPKLGQGKDSQFDRMQQIRQGYEDRGGVRGGNQAGNQKGDDREDGSQKRIAGGKREQLKGQEGAGPDIKKVFSDAAKKGFARQGWRDVYKEYSQVADDMLDQEQIPPGRRSVVRQYFELIRPRKGWGPR